MKQKTRIQSGRGFSGEASWTTAGAVLERREDGRGVVVVFVELLSRSRGTDLEMEGAGHDGRDDVLRQALWSVLDMMELFFFFQLLFFWKGIVCFGKAMKKRKRKKGKKLGRRG